MTSEEFILLVRNLFSTWEERTQKLIAIQKLFEEDCQTSDEKANLLFKLGIVLITVKEYEAAIASFDQVLKFNPDHEFAWIYRGDTLSKLKRYSEALDSYDRAIDIDIKSINSYTWSSRGDVLMVLNRYEDAIQSYNKAQQKFKPMISTYFELFDVGMGLKRYEHAIKSYKKPAQLKLNDDYIWSFCGDVLTSLERYEDAIESYDRAIDINPNDDYVLTHRGSVLMSLERYEDAFKSCERAIDINPHPPGGFAWSWGFRDEALFLSNRFKEVIDSYEQALNIDPYDNRTWYKRGRTLKYLRRYEEAIDSYDRVLNIDPDNEYAWTERGEALMGLDCYEGVIVCCNELLKINPNNSDALWTRAGALSHLERDEEATKSYTQAKYTDPKYYYTWYDKACFHARQGNVEQALENLQQAIKLEPQIISTLEEKINIDFNRIWHDERFEKLIQGINKSYSLAR